ncbi:MAG: hypothetical protein OSB19_01900 [Opitutaceae bacterium]|nr:hypothetical protein [Opitutaceae bacterium]
MLSYAAFSLEWTVCSVILGLPEEAENVPFTLGYEWPITDGFEKIAISEASSCSPGDSANRFGLLHIKYNLS